MLDDPLDRALLGFIDQDLADAEAHASSRGAPHQGCPQPLRMDGPLHPAQRAASGGKGSERSDTAPTQEGHLVSPRARETQA